MALSFHLNVVSAETELFSGAVTRIWVSGIMGDMEVLYNHASLLTLLKPGPVIVLHPSQKEEIFYISGGILEVQPSVTTVLADTAIRAQDVDEKQALEAKVRAEQILSGHHKDFDYAKAQSQLAEAIAQLRTLKKIRERHRI